MLNYIKYNDEKFAVTGEKDLHHSEINKIGGRWNSRMKGGAGWLVPASKESELKKLIRKVKKEHKSRTATDEQKDEETLEKVLEMVDNEIEFENCITNINEQKIDTEEVENEKLLSAEIEKLEVEKQNTGDSDEDYIVTVPELSIESHTEANMTTDEDATDHQIDEDATDHQIDEDVTDHQIEDEKVDTQEEQSDNTQSEQQIVDHIEHDKPEEEQNDEEMRSLQSSEEDSKTLGSMLKQEQEVIPSSCDEVENKHQELFDNYKSELTYNNETDDETQSEDSYTKSPGSHSKSETDSPSHNSEISAGSNSDDDTIINNMKDAKQAIDFADIDSDDDSAVVENFLNNLLGDLSDEEERTRKLKKSKERFRRITKSRELGRKKKQEKDEKIKFKQKVLEADSARKNVSTEAPTFEFYKNLAFRNASGGAAVSDSSDSDYSDESDDDYPSASTVKKKTKAEEIIDLEAEVAQLRLENKKLSTQIKTFIQKY